MIVSIVIVNWNTRIVLQECLNAVYAYPPQAEFEVWVVDNASTDGSVQMVRTQFPRVTVIENESNVGFARANNQAIRLSASRYIWLLNSDALVQAGTLQALIDFMEEHPRSGLAGPKLLNLDGSFQASFAAFPTLLSEFFLITKLARLLSGPFAPSPRPRQHERAQSIDWVAGAALLARREAIDQVGLLDEKYFLYSEETDWCWRFRRAGWEVWYLPQVTVKHYAGASSVQRSQASYAQLYLSKLRFFANAYGRGAAERLRAMLLITVGLRWALWGFMSLITWPFARGKYSRQRLQAESGLLQLLSHYHAG